MIRVLMAFALSFAGASVAEASCLIVRQMIIDRGANIASDTCTGEKGLSIDQAKMNQTLAQWVDRGGGGQDIRIACSQWCGAKRNAPNCVESFVEDITSTLKRALRDNDYGACRSYVR